MQEQRNSSSDAEHLYMPATPEVLAASWREADPRGDGLDASREDVERAIRAAIVDTNHADAVPVAGQTTTPEEDAAQLAVAAKLSCLLEEQRSDFALAA